MRAKETRAFKASQSLDTEITSKRVDTVLEKKLCQSYRWIIQNAISYGSFWLLPLVLILALSASTFGQIAIPLTQLNSELLKNSQGNISQFKVVGEQLFVGTDKGLWLVSKDGIQATQVVSGPRVVDKFEDMNEVIVVAGIGATTAYKARIDALEVAGHRLFAITFKGLWLISEDGKQATKIEQVKGSVYGSPRPYWTAVIEDCLFISTNEGFWMISDEGRQVDKVQGTGGNTKSITKFGDRLLIDSQNEGLLIFSNDGKRIGKLEKIEGGIDHIKAIGSQVFFSDKKDLWVISSSSRTPEKIKNLKGEIYNVAADGEQLYVSTTSHDLWAVDGDNRLAVKVEGIRVGNIGSVGERLFITNSKGLWTVEGHGKSVSKVEQMSGPTEFSSRAVGDKVFVNTEEDLWIVDGDSKLATRVSKLPSIYDDRIFNVVPAGDAHAFVKFFKSSSWIINLDEMRISRIESLKEFSWTETVGKYIYAVDSRPPGFLSYQSVYQVDPKAKIHAELVPSGWWSTAIGYLLPKRWLSSERVRVNACYSYSDDKCEDPYDKTIPRRFRFAIADGDTLPSNDKFSTAEQFGYQLEIGNNDVHYWVKDEWENVFGQSASYRGIPNQYFLAGMLFILPGTFVLGCLALSPKIDFCHSAIMNPWLRNYFSLGVVPLLLSSLPPLRRYVLQRYANTVNKDKDISQWKSRFVCPEEELFPENFGKKLESERRLLLTGLSGVGKTSFFKHLTAYYASHTKPRFPAKVFPVYIPLINYGGNSLEDLVYNQLFSYGKITDKELAPLFLEQGGLLIFLDGINEVQSVADRQKLSEFVERFWKGNYFCLSSQQGYPEIEHIPKVEMKVFTPQKICEFIRRRVSDKATAETVINNLTKEEYQLYAVARDLEFATEILNNGGKDLPKSRTELYKTMFGTLFTKWNDNGTIEAESNLCKRAYTMIERGGLAFDSVDNPDFKEITADLFEQKFLVRREGNYNFRHDLIRSYLASRYFYPRWKNLFEETSGKPIDSNWLEMLKFSCESIADSAEVKELVNEVLRRSIRKDLVKNLFEWLKGSYPRKCESWEMEFYTKYGEWDFK